MTRSNNREPTLDEIAAEIQIPKEEITYALDAIQTPVSLYDPIYTDGGEPLYVMDQISDKKNKEDRWVEKLSLSDAMKRLNRRENHIITAAFFEGKPKWKWRTRSISPKRRSAAWKNPPSRPCGTTSRSLKIQCLLLHRT